MLIVVDIDSYERMPAIMIDRTNNVCELTKSQRVTRELYDIRFSDSWYPSRGNIEQMELVVVYFFGKLNLNIDRSFRHFDILFRGLPVIYLIVRYTIISVKIVKKNDPCLPHCWSVISAMLFQD